MSVVRFLYMDDNGSVHQRLAIHDVDDATTDERVRAARGVFHYCTLVLDECTGATCADMRHVELID